MENAISQRAVSRRDFVKAAGAAGLAAGAATLAGQRSGKAALAAESADGGERTYVATEPSMKGDITVFTTIADGKVTAVRVLDDVDTPVIRDAAIADVPERIVAQQNVEVDATAGATMTSLAIKAGVSDALEAAGLDVSAFEKGGDSLATEDKAAGEDVSCDIVIVGAGMSGLSAAIYAKRQNPDLSVLVLEKEAYVGGSTRVCGGGIWSMGAQVNQIIGQDCSAEDYISFLTGWSSPVEINTDLLQNIHDISADTFDYLYNWGFPVMANGWSLGNPEAQLACLWSTEGQKTDWETGNSGVADFMATRAGKEGVEVRTNAKATGLVVEDGAVTGVTVEDMESVYTVSAKKVILASGGFTRNTDLIEQYAPDYEDAFAFTGAGSTGDGLTMALEAGVGASVVGQGMMGLFGLNPGLGYYGPMGNLVWQTPVTVNAEGQLFGMEGAFYGTTLRLLLDQTGACGYGVVDAATPLGDRFEAAVEAGYASKYDTLDDLAADQGIDAEALKQTCADNGVAQAPFYCVVKRPLFIGSIPGLKVNSECAVLGEGDQPVEGLFGAGELIFGNVFDNAYPCSGTGVGTSCYTGAIAARSAVSEL